MTRERILSTTKPCLLLLSRTAYRITVLLLIEQKILISDKTAGIKETMVAIEALLTVIHLLESHCNAVTAEKYKNLRQRSSNIRENYPVCGSISFPRGKKGRLEGTQVSPAEGGALKGSPWLPARPEIPPKKQIMAVYMLPP